MGLFIKIKIARFDQRGVHVVETSTKGNYNVGPRSPKGKLLKERKTGLQIISLIENSAWLLC